MPTMSNGMPTSSNTPPMPPKVHPSTVKTVRALPISLPALINE